MVYNEVFARARREKRDEFYTQMKDVEGECCYYTHHFRGKIIYCNCDDPRESNFFRYFVDRFDELGLRCVIAVGYKAQTRDLFSSGSCDRAVYCEYTGDGRIDVRELSGDGDFRSDESIAFLKRADIVVTNPPYSLFREYMAQLVEYGKSFLVMGCLHAAGYSSIFPLFRDNKVWFGISRWNKHFRTPYRDKLTRIGNIYWFTNLDHEKKHESLPLTKRYSECSDWFHKYDNSDAIDVPRVEFIPMDYDGVMGVPITFLYKYNTDQFEIVGYRKGDNGKALTINGTEVYNRILIKPKNNPTTPNLRQNRV